MAPEQVRGHHVGPAADVYSLGLLLLECATGHREYAGSAAEAAMARLSRPPLVPTSLPAPLPSLLAAMTRDDPDQRPSAQTCAAVLRGDAHALSTPSETGPDLGGTPSGTGATRPSTHASARGDDTSTILDLRHSKSRRDHQARGIPLAAAAVLVLMLLLGALALLDSPSQERQTPVQPSPSSSPAAAIPSSTPTDRTSPNAVVPAAPNPPPRLADSGNAGRDPGAGEENGKAQKKHVKRGKKSTSDR
jgi:hypothetical protein